MRDIVKRFLSIIGVNRAIFYFLSGKGFAAIATPITLYLISTCLDPVTQGYYYTLASLLAISLFFELGMGVVITQFASHEYAKLSWGKNNCLTGDIQALSRLFSILRKSLKWYAVICAIFSLIAIPVGLFFLGTKSVGQDINYVWPWVFTVIFFALGTMLIPFLSTIAGCGHVVSIQKMRIIQAVCRYILSWTVMLSGGKLFVVSVEFMMAFIAFLLWLIYNYRGLLKQLFSKRTPSESQISWGREILPMQWRVAVSWVAMFFAGCLFIPLLFSFQGPVEAGKMGMSLRLNEIIFFVSMAWVNTRAPLFGSLVKEKNFAELDRTVFRCTFQAICVGLFLTFSLLVTVLILKRYAPIHASRIISPYALFFLCLAGLCQVYTYALGSYLRAYKKEPFMLVQISLAVLVTASTYITTRYFNANAVAVSYFLVLFCVGIPYSTYVFLKKRKEWSRVVVS